MNGMRSLRKFVRRFLSDQSGFMQGNEPEHPQSLLTTSSHQEDNKAMPSKSFDAIEGVPKQALDRIRQDGLPDNVIESATGTIRGLPEPESVAAQAFLDAAERLAHQRSETSNPDPNQQRDDPATPQPPG